MRNRVFSSLSSVKEKMRRKRFRVFSSLLFRAQVVLLCLIQVSTTVQSLLNYFELALPTRRSGRGNPAVNEQSKNPRMFLLDTFLASQK